MESNKFASFGRKNERAFSQSPFKHLVSTCIGGTLNKFAACL